jgi:hypothetical protein
MAYGGALWTAINVPRPRALAAAQASSEHAVLSTQEWQTLEAMAARIIPADESPGAVEAGCVNFIDKALAHEDAALAPTFHDGLAALDTVARTRFDRPFAELAPSEQDELLVALQDDKVAGWTGKVASAPQFFESVRVQTIIGFLADPVHGGNRDHAGWKLLAYPGPAHHRGGYTPEQMLGKERSWRCGRKKTDPSATGELAIVAFATRARTGGAGERDRRASTAGAEQCVHAHLVVRGERQWLRPAAFGDELRHTRLL